MCSCSASFANKNDAPENVDGNEESFKSRRVYLPHSVQLLKQKNGIDQLFSIVWRLIGKMSKYRVKVYQSNTDIFYPEVYPPSLWKISQHFMFKWWYLILLFYLCKSKRISCCFLVRLAEQAIMLLTNSSPRAMLLEFSVVLKPNLPNCLAKGK